MANCSVVWCRDSLLSICGCSEQVDSMFIICVAKGDSLLCKAAGSKGDNLSVATVSKGDSLLSICGRWEQG